jgi:hypothetical protein
MKNINFSVDKSKFKEQLQETVKWFKTQMWTLIFFILNPIFS